MFKFIFSNSVVYKTNETDIDWAEDEANRWVNNVYPYPIADRPWIVLCYFNGNCIYRDYDFDLDLLNEEVWYD